MSILSIAGDYTKKNLPYAQDIVTCGFVVGKIVSVCLFQASDVCFLSGLYEETRIFLQMHF